MAENAFVRMYRDLVRRINALPEVRLSRVDPEAPAEPAEGWALSVGRQRVALGGSAGTPTDSDWAILPLRLGFSGSAWWCVRAGVVYLQGRVIRDAGNWSTSFTPFATLPAAARPSRPPGSPYTERMMAAMPGGSAVVEVTLSGVMSAEAGAGTATPWLELSSLSWPVAP